MKNNRSFIISFTQFVWWYFIIILIAVWYLSPTPTENFLEIYTSYDIIYVDPINLKIHFEVDTNYYEFKTYDELNSFLSQYTYTNERSFDNLKH